MAIVGIDLGTTNSTVTTMEHGRVEVLTNREGKQITPSVVYFQSNKIDDALVGETAVFSFGTDPARGVRFIKRRMGQDFNFHLDGQEYSPEEISAAILRKLKADAEEFFGGEEKVTDAVVTVPAWFEMREREATKRAAEMAGLTVRALLAEPIAAAIDYAQTHQEELAGKNVLVYDLGGGTFDVTAMEVTGEGEEGALSFRILGKDGSIELGGADWDKALAGYYSDDFAAAHEGKSPKDDPTSFDKLMLQCQSAKELLSTRKPSEDPDEPENPVSITSTHEGITHTVQITRSQFEELTLPLKNETIDKVNQLVERLFGQDAPWDKVDVILLVGGSTKMPWVAETLESLSGKVPRTNRGVDLNVGRGAAYLAFSPTAWTDKTGLDESTTTEPTPGSEPAPGTQSETTRDKIEKHGPKGRIQMVADVATDSIGINVVDELDRDVNEVLIKQGTEIGQEVEQTFGLYENNQTGVDILINRGDTTDLSQVEQLGHVRISGLPSNTRRGDPVRVKLRLNGDGLIVGEAEYVPTETKVDIRVELTKKGVSDPLA